MRLAYRTPVLAAASLLLLAACADAPLQPAAAPPPAAATAAAAAPITRHVEEGIVDLDGVYFSFACSADGEVLEDPEDGELVRMEGQLLVREVFMQDAAGNYHLTIDTRPRGLRGIGVLSGEEFRVVERQTGGAIQTSMLLGGHYRMVQAFVGLETGRRFEIVTRGHYVVGADDTPVVTRDGTTLRCRA